jgi:small conductance mechanosensitive channel
MATALKGLATAILYGVAVVAILEYVLVIPFSLVALGAVVALALSFAAQNLVKDLVNGVLILAEDQYALGDDIVIGSVGGIVERFNLRVTGLRTADGRLITIPNHAITQVENKTRRWSRADLRVAIAYATDVDHALSIIAQVAEETAHHPHWRSLILDPPELLGVEDISLAGIVIHFRIRTLPFKSEPVARELRRRLKIAFDREGIRIGMPQQTTFVEAVREAVEANGGRVAPGDSQPRIRGDA